MVSRILLIAALGVETLAAHQQARRATASATTVTSAPAASSSAPSCPYSNNTIYTASSGNQYVIECGVDHAAGDMGSTYVNDSLLECLNVCDSTPGCVDVSLSGAACYLKSTLGKALNDVGIQGARLLTSSTSSSASTTSSSTTASPTATGPTCPQSNNTVWTDSTGDQYMIECGIDRAQGDIATMDVSSLGQCIAKCSSTWGCVDVSLSGVACYMKNSIGAKSYNSDVLGARLVGNIYPSSSSTATATATGAVAAQTPLQCPDDNSTVYTASSGLQYLLSCDADYSGGDSTNVKVSSWSDCIEACDASVNCVALTLSGSACYEKSVVNDAAYAAGMYAARLITSAASSSSATATLTSATASATPTYVSCPASNGTSYTAANGEVFVVECDIDRPGGDLTEVDMTGTVAERFQQCIDTCANTTDCVDVSLSGVACYLKYILAEASYTEGMLGARYIGNASTPAATSASASATPTVPARTVVFVGGFEYLACYSDSITNRTLGGSNVLYSSAESPMTLEVCEQYCSSFGYFGTEAGSTCYCGDSIAGTASTVAVSECQSPCDGNSTEICGGASGLSLYHNRNVVAGSASSSSSSVVSSTSLSSVALSTSSSSVAFSTPPSSVASITSPSSVVSSTASSSVSPSTSPSSAALSSPTATASSIISSVSSVIPIPSPSGPSILSTASSSALSSSLASSSAASSSSAPVSSSTSIPSSFQSTATIPASTSPTASASSSSILVSSPTSTLSSFRSTTTVPASSPSSSIITPASATSIWTITYPTSSVASVTASSSSSALLATDSSALLTSSMVSSTFTSASDTSVPISSSCSTFLATDASATPASSTVSSTATFAYDTSVPTSSNALIATSSANIFSSALSSLNSSSSSSAPLSTGTPLSTGVPLSTGPGPAASATGFPQFTYSPSSVPYANSTSISNSSAPLSTSMVISTGSGTAASGTGFPHFTYSPSSSIYANFTSTTFGYAPSGSAAPTETASVETSTSTEVETAIVSPVPAGRSVEHLLRYSRRGRKYGA